jgi:hypothetical protein
MNESCPAASHVLLLLLLYLALADVHLGEDVDVRELQLDHGGQGLRGGRMVMQDCVNGPSYDVIPYKEGAM